jgi:integrase
VRGGTLEIEITAKNCRCIGHLSRINADTDVRRERRHLSPEDFSRLLEQTRQNGERCTLSGPERSMLYLTAAYTGLRASELASLTRASFDFDAGTVTVAAAYSKHRRQDVLPLHPDLSEQLQKWLSEHTSQSEDDPAVLSIKGDSEAAQRHLWPGQWAENRHGAEMVRHDLEAARQTWIDDAATPEEAERRERSDTLQYADNAGRVFDFHALRHQFISMLAAASPSQDSAGTGPALGHQPHDEALHTRPSERFDGCRGLTAGAGTRT